MIYWGLFLEENQNGKLEKQIKNQHITFGYKTAPPAEVIFGKEYQIKIVGYGINEENEGYEVELSKELKKFYNGAEKVHITLSTSKEGKAVNTKNVNFEPIAERVLKCKMGYFTKEQKVKYF